MRVRKYCLNLQARRRTSIRRRQSPAPSNTQPRTLRPQHLRQPLVLRGARGGAALLDLQLDGGTSPPGHTRLHTGREKMQAGASAGAGRCEWGCRWEQRLLTDQLARSASAARCSRQAARAAAPPERSMAEASATCAGSTHATAAPQAPTSPRLSFLYRMAGRAALGRPLERWGAAWATS